MRKLGAVALVLALLTGCAGTTFTKPEFTQEEWREQYVYCKVSRGSGGYTSSGSRSSYNPGPGIGAALLGGLVSGYFEKRRVKSCLEDLGWTVLEDD